MAPTLQYNTTAQRARIQTSSAGIHHPVAGKANHELTFKPDQLGGAGQREPTAHTLIQGYLDPEHKGDRHARSLIRLPFRRSSTNERGTLSRESFDAKLQRRA
jgi:hypothetical protein